MTWVAILSRLANGLFAVAMGVAAATPVWVDDVVGRHRVCRVGRIARVLEHPAG